MAVTTKPPHNNPNNNLNLLTSIPINMSSFTSSELHSISLLSNDTVLPASSSSITPSKFSINPSLSTHQQTYSFSPHHPRRHQFFLLNQQEEFESKSIISSLRKQLKFPLNQKPTKNIQSFDQNVNVEIVNRNGVMVNLADLEGREKNVDGGPFGEELKKRAQGRVKEEELLEMLGDMEGEWCSRRKKRRVVDASFLGDFLPLGWKLIIALRRKGGHFTPYCRRYISPTGEHLSSGKEVSSYLKPYFGINENDAKLEGTDLQEPQVVDSIDDSNSMLEKSNLSICNTSVSTERQGASILSIDDLQDVKVCDLYECHSCNVSFDEKDKYLEHVLSIHQNTTRRYTFESSVEDKVAIKEVKPEGQKKRKRRKNGSSVADGVIMKDGKYGCQFCDKVFEERRRYLGHVGNHVKGSIKSAKDADVQVIDRAKSPCLDRPQIVIDNSRMDALIEIAQSSIQDINIPVTEKVPAGTKNVDRLGLAESLHSVGDVLNTERNLGSCFNEADNGEQCSEGKRVFAGICSPELMNGISSVCPDETLGENDIGEGKISSEALHVSCDNVTEISMTGSGHLDYSEHEGQDIGENITLSLQLNPLDKNGEIQRNDRNFSGQTYSNENELKLQGIAGNGIDVNGRSKCTTVEGEKSIDEAVGLVNIHLIRCNGKSSNLESSDETLDLGDKYFPEHSQKNDGSELVTVSGKNHARGCAVPQISLSPSSPFDEIEKAGQNICSLDQNLESLTSLEYMKLDAIEPQMYKYSAMSREDSISLYEVSMDLETNIGIELGLENSLKPQSEIPRVSAGRCMATTVCVWCGVEFSHETIDVEPQPDSVGFMCPGCRAKISKQFNDLESNFPDFSLF